MHLHIQHVTRFTYSEPVFIEPLLLRLRPRSDCEQRLLEHDLHIDPTPAGQTQAIGIEGNDVTWAWFDGLHERLTLTARSLVDVSRDHPFDFVIADPAAAALPVSYPQVLRGSLTPYLAHSPPDDAVATLARQIADEADNQTVAFITRLTARLYDAWRHIVRPTGEPWPAEQTLSRGEGSCRDLAVLMAETCRAVGLAARFVSGYTASPADNPEATGDPTQGGADDERHLHAWVELFLPGAGWRGFDPSLGLAVDSRYVALAAGPDPATAAPTVGTYRSNRATSDMRFELQVQALPPPAIEP